MLKFFSNFSFNDSFAHGVHPPHHKEATEDLSIQRVPFVSHYIMPLGQHIGIPSVPVVVVGDKLKRGQMIAKSKGFISTALHSPVAGRVKNIGMYRYVDGSFREAIEIESDPYATQQFSGQASDVLNMDINAFIDAVQQSGIVGMGGAAFPSHVKYSIPKEQKITDILVNGAECEPFLTNDHRLMVERPETVLRGCEILRQQLGAARVTIGVEKNKPESIAQLQKFLTDDIPIDIAPLEVKYPQGAEKMLIKSIYNKELPAGKFPRDLGIAVNNIGTIVALADYFDHGMPLIERIVTLAGPGMESPANLIVPIGTPIRDVLDFAGGLKKETREVIMGGPMMGNPIADLDAPILKGTSGILAFTEAETARPVEYPCIRCSRCLDACPYFLNPSRFALLARARLFEDMQEKYHVMDCVECGACTYACPSNIPIVQHIRTAKDALRNIKVDA
ncbi:MAG: electron transport complex subunit RsxC [gamma proteobacterium symbiont of Taylorina sp.]|nr:electron transport complex subunit RsxC [gamma proteobacterium symbiont of Taylorina sp.]